MRIIKDLAQCSENPTSERAYRVAQIDIEAFGMILARAYEIASSHSSAGDSLGKRRSCRSCQVFTRGA